MHVQQFRHQTHKNLSVRLLARHQKAPKIPRELQLAPKKLPENPRKPQSALRAGRASGSFADVHLKLERGARFQFLL